MILVKWICLALALIFTAWLIPGFEVSSIWAALLACVIIAMINTFIKPIVKLVTLPINILTLGLFTLVINALLFMLASWLSPGLEVEGFWSALFGSIIFSLLSVGINKIDSKA